MSEKRKMQLEIFHVEKFKSKIKPKWIKNRNLLTISTTETSIYRLFEKVYSFPGSISCSNNNTIVVFDTNGSFYDIETGKKTSEFEIGNVVICEWIQTFNSDWLIYCTKDTVYLRLNQSLLIREIKIQAKKVDLFDNNLIVINDKIHFYNLKDLDFYLIFSKKKLVLDNQVHSIKVIHL